MGQLDYVVNEVVAFFHQALDFDAVIYTDWTAKDILGHLTSWHESFARNLHALVSNRAPQPLKGSLADVNEIGVLDKRQYPLEVVIEQLLLAHRSVEGDILSDSLTLIPYKRGSRAYTPEEHLEVVINHLSLHLKDLKAHYKPRPRAGIGGAKLA